MKNIVTFIVSIFFVAAFCAAQNQVPGSAFHQEGIASWYGAEFEGRPTASGELFDPNQYTAAHPDLPFGTVLIITNAVNGEKVMVRVNDRGPFVKSRIIDVSRAAAEQLNMLETGTAQVIIELAPRNSVAGVSGGSVNSPAQDNSVNIPVQQPQTAQNGITSAQAETQAVGTQPVIGPPVRTNVPAASEQASTRLASPPVPSYMPQQPAIVSGPQTRQQTAATAPATPAVTRQQTAAPTTPAVTRQQTAAPPVASFQPVPTTARPPAPSSSTNAASAMPNLPAASAAPSIPAQKMAQQQRSYPSYPAAEISGGPFVNGRYYRLQIGSYKVAKNAVEVFDRLAAAGLNPQWEPYGDLYRIVLSNVKAEDINSISARLGNAGFKEAIAREER